MPRFVRDEPAFDADAPLLHAISQNMYNDPVFIAGNKREADSGPRRDRRRDRTARENH